MESNRKQRCELRKKITMRFNRSRHRNSLFKRALPVLDRWATPVGNRFRCWASPRLVRFERHFSRSHKIAAITAFCLLAACYSITVLVQAISGPSDRSPDYLSPPPISRPLPRSSVDSLSSQQQRPAPTDTISKTHP